MNDYDTSFLDDDDEDGDIDYGWDDYDDMDDWDEDMSDDDFEDDDEDY